MSVSSASISAALKICRVAHRRIRLRKKSGATSAAPMDVAIRTAV